ncbi:MAG: type III pantothenate kinase [Candidatus Omnitrophota bacterium]|nr:type III pantothenate kinase [Candidatus Omnitrophota bacterium]
MILAVDIGNTTTSFGVFERGRLRSHFAIATQSNRTPDEITLQLKALANTRRLHLKRARQIMLCSVVPRMSSVLIQALRSLHTVPLRIVGQDLQVPLTNRYTYPEQVGQDRLVGAYAAWQEFGKGRARPGGRERRTGGARGKGRGGRGGDCIVADFGTAITIDVVTQQGEYLGGLIAPGLELSLDALAARTALLPKVELREPPELLGRDTANSIRAGLVYGCAALCDGLVDQLKRRYVPGATVVATGGASALIARHAKTIDHLRPHLVLEGLARLGLPGLPKKRS